MKASKENCRESLSRLIMMTADPMLQQKSHLEAIKFIREFLEAAEKKLPCEESFKKDMLRRAGNAER